VLFVTEALRVVALSLEELLEMSLAVVFSLMKERKERKKLAPDSSFSQSTVEISPSKEA